MRPDLVIFDCDGVLVDSEPIALAQLTDRLSRAGIDLEPEEAKARFLGRSLSGVREIIAEAYSVRFSDEELQAMRAELHAVLRKDLNPMEGVVELLDGLDATYCVASSSQTDRVRLSLEATGLLPYFEPHIFSAAMVARGKPAPDLFLFAAEQMDASPDSALVIEDSPAGVAAARSAGMRALGFTGGGHACSLADAEALRDAGAEAVFDRMSGLGRHIRRLRDERGH